MQANSGETRITAVLGPTNTGKTHLAVERMLGHSSGMIGCPLRLLAREIYDRVKLARGVGAVALITGEERIVPAAPRYLVCTVESMPLDRQVEFLAIDEVQLAADPERGHVFTDRLLHARGRYEEAIDALKEALARSPDMLPAYRKLAAVYVELGRMDEARAQIARHMKVNPVFSLDEFRQEIPIKDRATLERYIKALLKAGLPQYRSWECLVSPGTSECL